MQGFESVAGARLTAASCLAVTPAGHRARYLLLISFCLVATAIALLAMGRVGICKCGTVKLWHGVVQSSENSQHISDWYTLSHIVHGFLFYCAAWIVTRLSGLKVPFMAALLAAVTVEAAWEIFENTDFIINRYREATISLDYYGDSVINSLSDIAAMIAGFLVAGMISVSASVLLVLTLEGFAAYMIRDNLLLNIIMLVHPLDAIRLWQLGS